MLIVPKRYLPVFAATLALGFTACASSGPIPGSAAERQAQGQQVRTSYWGIKTREHVDLWLHGFALLQVDTARIPLFDKTYRDEIVVVKNKANVLTQLDVNVERLQKTLAQTPALINAQFLPQFFTSGATMRATIDAFVAANGNPNAASSQQEAYLFQSLLNYFPTPVERQWLALFSSSLWDENEKFFNSYWVQQQRERKQVLDSLHTLWTNYLHPKVRNYLNSTKQANGEILLSLPLKAEGRTSNIGSGIGTSVAVNFPRDLAHINEAVYGVAHEIIIPLAYLAVTDNTTPAQQRNGEADLIVSAAAVRGGYTLLSEVAPEYAEGYARFYLNAIGKTKITNPKEELVKEFPVPQEIMNNISSQLATISGGI